MKKLSENQRVILAFCSAFIEAHGYPPTRQEIAEAFLFKSSNSAEEYLRILARKGFITISPRTSRGIALSISGKAFLNDLAQSIKKSNEVSA